MEDEIKSHPQGNRGHKNHLCGAPGLLLLDVGPAGMHNYYDSIQNSVFIFTIVFFLVQASRVRKYSKEEKDELAIQNLRRTDAIGLKIMVAATIAIAFPCAVGAIDGSTAGYALVGMILVLAVARFVIFCVMDSKGV